MAALVTYIGSATRSGSTLLDRAIARQPGITSVGEVFHLRAYALDDRSLYNPIHPLVCSCGSTLQDCRFWQEVEDALGRPLGSLELKPGFLEYGKRRNLFARLSRRVFSTWPRSYYSNLSQTIIGGSAIGADSFALFDAIAAVSRAQCIVDSSKTPFRFASLYAERPESMRLILLCRNYLAVVHSQMKRGRSIEESMKAWTSTLREFEVLAKHVPENQIKRVRYEDFCADPERKIRDLVDWIGIESTDETAELELHHLGGSPSKFDPGRQEIKLDERYLDAGFSDSQRALMRSLAGDFAEDWGYV